MGDEDQKDVLKGEDRACMGFLIREYIDTRNKLDAINEAFNGSIHLRKEVEARLKASEVVENALREVIDKQNKELGYRKTQEEKLENQVLRDLRKMPDFMIVSLTTRGDIQAMGKCKYPGEFHRHVGYYLDHPEIKQVALYAKVEFPDEDCHVMVLTYEGPLEVGQGPLEVGQNDEGELQAIHVEGDKKGEDDPMTEDEKETEGNPKDDIEEIQGAAVPEDWEKHLNTYTEVMNLCYDRALTVCIMPEIAGRMALAMYDSIAGGQNAAYREFLDAMKLYLEKLNEPPPALEPLPGFPGPPFGFGVFSPDYEKPPEARQHPGVEYDKWLVITEYPNGDYHVSHYHEGIGGGSGKPQAIDFYRKCRDHPTVRRAFLAMNISDQVPTEDRIAEGAPIARDAEKTEDVLTGKEPEGEGK